MEKNANDKLIWVDLFDNEIGSGDKLETHVKNQLHRAFLCLSFMTEKC